MGSNDPSADSADRAHPDAAGGPRDQETTGLAHPVEPSPGGGGPARVRVVLCEARAQRPAADLGRADLAEQTPIGEALVRGLVRAQLALALRLALVVVAGLGLLPLLFAVAPAVGEVAVLGIRLPWLILGVLSFPFLIVVGAAYVHWAERNEQDFTAVIRRPPR